MAVVKANAYGHGSVEVARQALESGASELAVASVEEGIVLRRAGITAPILVLGFTALSCVKKSAVWNITLSAFQVSWIKKANRILEKEADSKRLSIHINVDTGMVEAGCAYGRRSFSSGESAQVEYISVMGWHLYTFFNSG